MAGALIIFVRNPVLGKVKTRLARALGKEAALHIYNKLLDYTHSITNKIAADKYIFYDDFIYFNDIWENEVYKKELQTGSDLGERMLNAFKFLFDKNYKEVIIIGSDCFELTEEIISSAFTHLREVNITIGPATDGGYYLLGMNKFIPQLFENKKWSSNCVFADTVKQLNELNISFGVLPVLSDVDDAKDVNFNY